MSQIFIDSRPCRVMQRESEKDMKEMAMVQNHIRVLESIDRRQANTYRPIFTFLS